ncbi:SMP-30/gluconolactonase/LRE family protein [Streptomyces sp. NPDC049879]|uniref:SMP-30/gluconolactonase/LRE family protein n=1 Tax=Streptomyces sp. NPDC049879 TaxID=3365598 RepID=UPI003797AD69
MQFTPVIDGWSFLEGPRWRDGRIWVSDFYTERVLAVEPSGATQVVAAVPQQPSGLGWLPDGRMLIVSMRDRKLLRREHSGELAEHADLSAFSDTHLNDMAVDARGRAYITTFGFDLMAFAPVRDGALLRVDPDGTVSEAAGGLKFPNGPVITPDGRTLIVNESCGNRVTAFDIHPDGTLGGRRVWADFGSLPDTDDVLQIMASMTVGADGSALDADGNLWVADAIHHRALRIAPGGDILDEIPTGEDNVLALALGGDDGRTLFLCLVPNFFEEERRATRVARMVSTRVDVPLAGLG